MPDSPLQVDKIEKLLAGGQDLASTSAGAVDGGPDADGLSGGAGGGLIERVASEFNQLQFYVTQCKKAPFLDNIKPRIITITTTLQEALEQSFRNGIETNDAEVLRQCLRTYSIIDKIDDVEVRQLRHPFGPFLTHFSSRCHCTRAVRCALLGAHAC